MVSLTWYVNYWAFIIIYELRLNANEMEHYTKSSAPMKIIFISNMRILRLFLTFILHELTINMILPLNCDNFRCARILFWIAFSFKQCCTWRCSASFRCSYISILGWNKRLFHVKPKEFQAIFRLFARQNSYVNEIYSHNDLHRCIRWEIVHVDINSNTVTPMTRAFFFNLWL